MIEYVIVAGVAALVGGGVVRKRWPRVEVVHEVVKEIEYVTEYVPPRGDVKPRFLLTHKKGRILTDNMAEVSQEIVKLRAAGQPYEYYVDGKRIHPKE